MFFRNMFQCHFECTWWSITSSTVTKKSSLFELIRWSSIPSLTAQNHIVTNRISSRFIVWINVQVCQLDNFEQSCLKRVRSLERIYHESERLIQVFLLSI